MTEVEFSNFKTWNKKKCFNRLSELQEAYYNGIPEMEDYEFDQLVEIYETRFGPFEKVGSSPKNSKVELPYHLGSLDKIKDEHALALWTTKNFGEVVISDKVDGLSALLVQRDGERFLYTRGDGDEGSDITHLLKYLKLPTSDPEKELIVRGELVMMKETFNKYSGLMANARNMVSGTVNAKKSSVDPKFARDISFVAYQILSTETRKLSVLEKFETIRYSY